MKRFASSFVISGVLLVLAFAGGPQVHAAGLPDFVKTLLNAAHDADSTIPSGDAVDNAMPVLSNCFGLFGSESLDGCVNALAAAGGASAQQQADLKSMSRTAVISPQSNAYLQWPPAVRAVIF